MAAEEAARSDCESDNSMVVRGPRDLLYEWLFKKKNDISPAQTSACLILRSGVMPVQLLVPGRGLSASRGSPARMVAKPA